MGQLVRPIEERIQVLKGEKKELFSRIVESAGGQMSIREHFQTLNSLIELEEPSEEETSGDQLSEV